MSLSGFTMLRMVLIRCASTSMVSTAKARSPTRVMSAGWPLTSVNSTREPSGNVRLNIGVLARMKRATASRPAIWCSAAPLTLPPPSAQNERLISAFQAWENGCYHPHQHAAYEERGSRGHICDKHTDMSQMCLLDPLSLITSYRKLVSRVRFPPRERLQANAVSGDIYHYGQMRITTEVL